MYIPQTGELVIFLAAFIGALIGFLWYNSFPAQVFMGDTGSLAIGGIIAVVAIMIRKELLIPILCGIFFVESLSVIIQRLYFKYTKKRYGQGRRILPDTATAEASVSYIHGEEFQTMLYTVNGNVSICRFVSENCCQ